MKIGIVGAGQLAQMMAQAAKKLDLKTVCLALSADECAKKESALCVVPAFESHYADAFLHDVDLITIETENIPLSFAEYLSTHKTFYPRVNALAIAQDRLFEKELFDSVNLPPAPYFVIDSFDDIPEAIENVGLPGILKTRRMGYDGKGQIRCASEEDLINAVKQLSPAPMIYEGFVSFEKEVSLIGVRSISGATDFYPLCENEHENGILRKTTAPFMNDALFAKAKHHMKNIFEALNYVGILTIEFFIKDGELIGNEMAPRVHNSGHWTIEGAQTSQFENHLRAIAGLPLGSCAPKGTSVMINIIGELPDKMQEDTNTFYHFYEKEPCPGRKLGHVTMIVPKK